MVPSSKLLSISSSVILISGLGLEMILDGKVRPAPISCPLSKPKSKITGNSYI